MKITVKSFIFIVSSTFLFSTPIFANDYVRFECPSDTIDFMACNNRCVYDSKFGLEAKFKINVDKDLVIVTNYFFGNPLNSSVLKNCRVVDKKNWACGLGTSADEWQMRDGTVSFSTSDYGGSTACFQKKKK